MLRRVYQISKNYRVFHLTFRPIHTFSQNPFQQNKQGLQTKDNLTDLPESDPLREALKAEEAKDKPFDEDEGSYAKENNSTVFIYSMGAVALVIGYLFMQLNQLSFNNKTATNQVQVSYTGKAQIGGPWKLLTVDGQEMTHKDLEGNYYLIYFGFCNCPDICPNSLHKLSKAIQRIRNLPEGKLIKLKSLFVTVDPDRDDPERIKKFLSHFDPQMIGLTAKSNDDPNLKEAMRNFKIYASKITYDMPEDEGKSENPIIKKDNNPYTIDHTIITYLMDDKNNYVTHLGSNMGEYDLAKTIIEKILENERQKRAR